MLQGKFIAANIYTRKEEAFRSITEVSTIQKLEKESKTKYRVKRRKVTIKIRAEINGQECKNIVMKTNQ